jgi:hypothetical protein
MYDSTMAFEVKLLPWKDQLKLRNGIYFPHMKSFDTVYSERIQKSCQSIICVDKSSND